MAGTSKTNRKKGNVPIEHECLLNFLPRDIWVRIATKVTSNSIHDLFNMQVTCKVFLCVASSNAVYQHATMWYIPLVFFSFYLNRPERRFLDRCVEAKNADAILRQGLTEHFWIARRDIGMELLTRASTEGSVEAGYLCAMLPLCDHEDEEEVQRGVEMLEFIHTSGMVERCREFFTDIFWERWIDERSSDQGQTWLVGPPLALPAAPWLMCPVSRVCTAWRITRSGFSWRCLHFRYSSDVMASCRCSIDGLAAGVHGLFVTPVTKKQVPWKSIHLSRCRLPCGVYSGYPPPKHDVARTFWPHCHLSVRVDLVDLAGGEGVKLDSGKRFLAFLSPRGSKIE
ncbi:hypothetical protein Ahy_B05g079530 [Arachis hypogaea]|uniref:At2g35280-like TPR domain-containing protein n=1 Tax=Arachis hypogaea TaxID=3818 RepID=A0A444ZA30_ARAHY|nr:hypothetical protein Ahy_B05g079530 [Arachis hypogaea]